MKIADSFQGGGRSKNLGALLESSYLCTSKNTTVPTCSQSSPPRLWLYEPNLKKTASKGNAMTRGQIRKPVVKVKQKLPREPIWNTRTTFGIKLPQNHDCSELLSILFNFNFTNLKIKTKLSTKEAFTTIGIKLHTSKSRHFPLALNPLLQALTLQA